MDIRVKSWNLGKTMSQHFRPRRVVHDNIATKLAPVYRARYATPLTERRIRGEYIKQAFDLPELERDAWLSARMTPLDRLLTDRQAACLEWYCDAEARLSGSARSTDYLGDRVRGGSGGGGPTPIHDDALGGLAEHSRIKARLGEDTRAVLMAFCAQMWGSDDAWTDAQAAIKLRVYPEVRHKAHAWHLAVRDAAEELVRMGY
jgi:hypothetical protein